MADLSHPIGAYVADGLLRQDMDHNQRRAYFLLKLVVFFYPRPDDSEADFLKAMASDWQADEDRRWAIDLVESHPATAYERVRDWLDGVVLALPSPAERERFIEQVWAADIRLPYITEMQGLSLLRLTENWGIREKILRLLGRS